MAKLINISSTVFIKFQLLKTPFKNRNYLLVKGNNAIHNQLLNGFLANASWSKVVNRKRVILTAFCSSFLSRFW